MSTQRLVIRTIAAVLALSALLACGHEAERPDTLVIVSVSADALVAERLARLEVRTSPVKSGDSAMPKTVAWFAFGAARRGETSVTLPFSFTVARRDADVFRLELLGYPSSASDAILERRELVRFRDRETVSISIDLRQACLDKVCARADETCSPLDEACVPLAEATSVATVPGRETFSDLDGLDTDSVDAGASETDASPTELPPEPLPTCAVENACPLADYPCLPSDDGLGYTCRGQYAAWPMPDAQSDAKQRPSYRVEADNGVVHDEVTGLLWQRDLPASYAGCTGRKGPSAGDTCSWQEAKHYCSQLALAGKRWRLPSKIELESLIDPTRQVAESFIDPDAFPATIAQGFWTSSSVALAQLPNHAYVVAFASGLSANAPISELFCARCVRSERVPDAKPAERYLIDEANGAVRDRFTGLEWRRGASASPVTTLDDARKFCMNRGGGYRVPTHKELLTLADITSPTSAEPDAFARGEKDWLLWSTSPVILGETLVYYPPSGTSLGAKFTDINPMLQAELHVRCVR